MSIQKNLILRSKIPKTPYIANRLLLLRLVSLESFASVHFFTQKTPEYLASIISIYEIANKDTHLKDKACKYCKNVFNLTFLKNCFNTSDERVYDLDRHI